MAHSGIFKDLSISHNHMNHVLLVVVAQESACSVEMSKNCFIPLWKRRDASPEYIEIIFHPHSYGVTPEAGQLAQQWCLFSSEFWRRALWIQSLLALGFRRRYHYGVNGKERNHTGKWRTVSRKSCFFFFYNNMVFGKLTQDPTRGKINPFCRRCPSDLIAAKRTYYQDYQLVSSS